MTSDYTEMLLYLLVAGYMANNVWRWAGVFASRGLDENSEILRWVRAVSTALVAGLVAKIVLFPSGDLASIAMELRLSAFAFAIVVFFAARQSVVFGIIGGEIALLGLYWLFG